MPQVSIVIRNRNEGESLRKLLASLEVQTVHDREIILVDNESEDDSLQVGRSAGVRIVSISKSDFTYGRALNAGIEEASADVVVLLSPHSIPLQKDFLEIIIDGFSEDTIAGLRCVQATRREEVPDWHREFELDASSSVEEVLRWGLNATCCAIRKSVWDRVRFDEEIEAVEDKLWTQRVLHAGYRIRRVPAVYAYIRNASRARGILRSYREALGAYRAFGVEPSYSILGPLSACTVGGARRYLEDCYLSWRGYFLMRRVKKDASRKAKAGSLW